MHTLWHGAGVEHLWPLALPRSAGVFTGNVSMSKNDLTATERRIKSFILWSAMGTSHSSSLDSLYITMPLTDRKNTKTYTHTKIVLWKLPKAKKMKQRLLFLYAETCHFSCNLWGTAVDFSHLKISPMCSWSTAPSFCLVICNFKNSFPLFKTSAFLLQLRL